MRVVLVAGEPSGDLLGARLVERIGAHCPTATFEGIAGPQMMAAGCKSIYPMERLSVMGLFEVAGRYLELLPVRRRLIREWTMRPPDVFVGIDAPDFNLSVELSLRRAGVTTVHYVSPSVWAWRRYRVRKIAKAVDLMLTLFPFEARFYWDHGVCAQFIGHPLADTIPLHCDQEEVRGKARAELTLACDGPVVALLPGSRMSEVRRLAQPMVQAAAWLHGRDPRIRFIVPLVDAATRACFMSALQDAAATRLAEAVRVVDGCSRQAMAASDVVLLASGTAALEAMLLKRPMVITYKTLPATWLVGKSMLHTPFVGLPNVLAGRSLVPELLQEAATPAALGAAVLAYLRHPERGKTLKRQFDAIHAELRNDASEHAAQAVLETAHGGTQAGVAA